MAKNIEWLVTAPSVMSGLAPTPRVLSLTVDLSRDFGLSTTGKSRIVAQTDSPRFEMFEAGGEEFMFSLNVIKKIKK